MSVSAAHSRKVIVNDFKNGNFSPAAECFLTGDMLGSELSVWCWQEAAAEGILKNGSSYGNN